MILTLTKAGIQKAFEENDIQPLTDDFISEYQNKINKQSDEYLVQDDDFLDGVISEGIENYENLDTTDDIMYYEDFDKVYQSIIDSLYRHAKNISDTTEE